MTGDEERRRRGEAETGRIGVASMRSSRGASQLGRREACCRILSWSPSSAFVPFRTRSRHLPCRILHAHLSKFIPILTATSPDLAFSASPPPLFTCRVFTYAVAMPNPNRVFHLMAIRNQVRPSGRLWNPAADVYHAARRLGGEDGSGGRLCR